MQHAKREASGGSNSVARWILISVAASALVAAGWLTVRAMTPDRPARNKDKGDDEAVATASAEEIAKLKASISRLERTSSALKVAVAASEREGSEDDPAAPAAEAAAQAPPEAAVDPAAELAKHREVLRDLDVALAKDQGNLVQRNESAATFREQLDNATKGKARVVDLQCATDFCKAVLEEDTSVQPAMNTSEIIDATPFLAQEAMFDYETEGTRKRTLVYAALDGRSLPFDRENYATP